MADSAAEFTLVDKCVLPVSGNVGHSALVFGDADNDESHDAELVIGTLNGELIVYKGTSILCSATDLGSVCAFSLYTSISLSSLCHCYHALTSSVFVCSLGDARTATDNLGVC